MAKGLDVNTWQQVAVTARVPKNFFDDKQSACSPLNPTLVGDARASPTRYQ